MQMLGWPLDPQTTPLVRGKCRVAEDGMPTVDSSGQGRGASGALVRTGVDCLRDKTTEGQWRADVNYMDVDPNASIAEFLRVPLPRHMQDIGCAAVEFPTD